MSNRERLLKLPWNGWGRVFVTLAVLIGSAYVIMQWLMLGRVDDPVFVGLLSANTFLIYRLTRQIRLQIEISAEHYERELIGAPIKFKASQFSRDVFGWYPALFVGLAFGTVFFVVTYRISPWHDTNVLNILLCSFLLTANVVTGMALSSLCFYFRLSFLVGSNIQIDLWDRDRPSIAAIVSTNRNIVVAASVISCFGVTSILFSKFTISAPVITFSFFALLVILTTYITPLIPLTAQIREKKLSNINRISRLIEGEYEMLNESHSVGKREIDIGRFESLNSLYRSVKSVKEFPPVGGFSKNTALSVTVLTLLPSVIKFILDGLR